MTQADRWKNRRRMAWAALVGGLAYPLLLLYTESDQLGAVAGPFYVFITGVLASYYGWATVDDNNHKDDAIVTDWPAKEQ
jgi:hypothetical protein